MLSNSFADFVPYLFLTIAVFLILLAPQFAKLMKASRFCAFLAIAATLWNLQMNPLGMVWLAIAIAVLLLCQSPSFSKALRIGLMFCFLFFAFELGAHLVPAFHRLTIFDQIKFSERSSPFSMEFCLDQILVGLVIWYFYLPLREKAFAANTSIAKSFTITGQNLLILSGLLISAGLLSGYIAWDPKWPQGLGLWSLNNFFFVCFAEEAFFRGLLMNFLKNLFGESASKSALWFALLVSSLLFGVAHWAGGTTYMGLATVAGLFYGWTYLRTGDLRFSMLIHFSLNLIHLLFFTYPSIQL